MSGDGDAALFRLGRLSVVDLDALDQPITELLASPTLDPLHQDPRWLPLVKRLEVEQTVREAHYDKALRQALAVRVNKDQDIRNRLGKDRSNKALLEEITEIDADNLAWLKQVVDRQGWPTITQVGPDGAGSFWLLAQHADSDPAFQERVLSLMTPLVTQREALGYQLAYLTDRVRRARDEPQVYGTQLEIVNDRIVPETLQAPEQVDARRAGVGLGPLNEYISVNEANRHSQES
ncbi:hypothetical protein SAMN05428989_3547 [Pseudoxanthomonas sp. GM95]|uniref:DUF6624 domain-containing protein n=1 Tax=Pseudoxanthomonas sp. GM95 TaxID=1881043 RepID=UPI0008C4A8F9|nr:DUF6624 domain-containing protein [Pseudoxanthomonas sp. GM95]SEM26196.1 hypothetical protein SAMN05428989_3547 [Pseudoxanthomonas sp. GM95]